MAFITQTKEKEVQKGFKDEQESSTRSGSYRRSLLHLLPVGHNARQEADLGRHALPVCARAVHAPQNNEVVAAAEVTVVERRLVVPVFFVGALLGAVGAVEEVATADHALRGAVVLVDYLAVLVAVLVVLVKHLRRKIHSPASLHLQGLPLLHVLQVASKVNSGTRLSHGFDVVGRWTDLLRIYSLYLSSLRHALIILRKKGGEPHVSCSARV
eukprot:5484873-Prymnesium_polylepis.1